MHRRSMPFLMFGLGSVLGVLGMARLCERALLNENKRAERYILNFGVSCDWIGLFQSGDKIIKYFENNNINEIAIYGMGELGKRLYNELENSGINIKYVIDRDNKKWSGNTEIYLPQDDLPEVSAIIVTPILDYEDIKVELNRKLKAEVISLKTIIYEMQENLYDAK